MNKFLLSVVVAGLLLSGCEQKGEEKALIKAEATTSVEKKAVEVKVEDTKTIEENATKIVEDVATKIEENVTNEIEENITNEIEENVTNKIEENITNEVGNVTQKIDKSIDDTTKAVETKLENIGNKLEETSNKVEEKVENATKSLTNVLSDVKQDVENKVDNKKGELLYAKCKSCHGVDAGQKALGKSQVIKGWSVQQIETALKGYKDGSYGGAMKGVMAAQASTLSEDDIKAISDFISKL